MDNLQLLDNLQSMMDDAQKGRQELTYIGAPKTSQRQRDLLTYAAVEDLIAARETHTTETSA